MKVDKSKLDVSQIFLIYMTVVGDIDKCAMALDLDPAIVASLASSEGWSEKIRRISLISKSGKPGEWERAQNRALNFVQAHRVRSLLDRMITHYASMTGEQLANVFCSEHSTKEGGGIRIKTPSAKFLSDLMCAAERAHHLSYAALGDTVIEREARIDEEGNSVSAASLHASLIAALNSPASAELSAEMLVRESASVIESQTVDVRKELSDIEAFRKPEEAADLQKQIEEEHEDSDGKV